MNITVTFNIDLISDIHSDRQKWNGEVMPSYDYAAHKKNDIVIAAGDLAASPELALEELQKLSAAYGEVLYITGNHEFIASYEGAKDFDLYKVETQLRQEIKAMPNVTYLDDTIYKRDGVAIIGSNGFWDFKCCEDLPDGHPIKISATEGLTTFTEIVQAPNEEEAAVFARMAHRDFENMRDKVIALNKDDSIHTIAVVTHTVPHRAVLNYPLSVPRERHVWLANTEMEQLRHYDQNHKIKFWMFGHQHQLVDEFVEGIHYIANPHGFYSEKRMGYVPRVVDLGKPPGAAVKFNFDR